MQRHRLSRCRRAASEIQPERVSIYNPCHSAQNSVSLSRSLCGSSGINGDVDIFRQSVYLILMLSNQSQSPPHGAIGARHRPQRLALALAFPIHPSRLSEFITMVLLLVHVMSFLLLLFTFQSDVYTCIIFLFYFYFFCQTQSGSFTGARHNQSWKCMTHGRRLHLRLLGKILLLRASDLVVYIFPPRCYSLTFGHLLPFLPAAHKSASVF